MKKKVAIIVTIILSIIFCGIVVGINFKENNKLENEIKESIDNEKDEFLDIESDSNEDNEEVIKVEEDKTTTSKEENSSPKEDTKIPVKSETDKNEEVKKEETTIEENNTKEEVISKEEQTEEINESKNELPTIVSSETKEEKEITYKYGVKVTTTKTYILHTYSDGSTDKQEIGSKNTYDKSTFSATTNELKSEATSLKNKNRSVYTEVFNYVNEYRLEANKTNLVLNDELCLAATIRALEMAWSSDYMDISHTRPNGTSCFTVYDEIGYYANAMGENIAAGYRNAKSVSEGWKNSPGHYANMISDDFSKIGIGMVELDGIKYWVQLFSN